MLTSLEVLLFIYRSVWNSSEILEYNECDKTEHTQKTLYNFAEVPLHAHTSLN